MSLRLALSNPTLPEITDGYEIPATPLLGHDPGDPRYQGEKVGRSLCEQPISSCANSSGYLTGLTPHIVKIADQARCHTNKP